MDYYEYFCPKCETTHEVTWDDEYILEEGGVPNTMYCETWDCGGTAEIRV